VLELDTSVQKSCVCVKEFMFSDIEQHLGKKSMLDINILQRKCNVPAT